MGPIPSNGRLHRRVQAFDCYFANKVREVTTYPSQPKYWPWITLKIMAFVLPEPPMDGESPGTGGASAASPCHSRSAKHGSLADARDRPVEHCQYRPMGVNQLHRDIELLFQPAKRKTQETS
jgi:hypothetical protein